jgi:hypothetical protein
MSVLHSTIAVRAKENAQARRAGAQRATVGISRGISMGRLEKRVRAVWATDVDLLELGRRGLENLERQNAVLRATQTGRIADDAELDLPVLSEADAARYGAQLRRLDESAFAMPRVDTLLTPQGTHQSESRRLSDSLANVERAELRLHHA